MWCQPATPTPSVLPPVFRRPSIFPTMNCRNQGRIAAALAVLLAAAPALAFSPASPQPILRVAPTVSSHVPSKSASTLTRRHVAATRTTSTLRMADAAAATAAEEPEESVGGGTATVPQLIFNLVKASELIVVLHIS